METTLAELNRAIASAERARTRFVKEFMDRGLTLRSRELKGEMLDARAGMVRAWERFVMGEKGRARG